MNSKNTSRAIAKFARLIASRSTHLKIVITGVLILSLTSQFSFGNDEKFHLSIRMLNAQGLNGPDSAVSAIQKGELGLISEIKIVGNKKIEKDAVLAKIKSKQGGKADRATVADDIRAIHSLGYFDDVSVDYTSGVLTYTLVERPTIVSISFSGNDQISNSDLKDVVKVKEYSILDINKVKEDIGLIQKHYEEKGFYLARVSHEVRKTSKSDEVELVYKVNDYDKVKIKKITFINNKRMTDERLKSILRNTKEGNFFSWVSSSGSFKESAFKQDLQFLTYYYLNEGYVKFRYETPVVTVSEDKKWLFISIYVDEGDKYSIGDVDFGGDLLFDKSELNKDLLLLPGNVFSIVKRNEDIQKLTEKYQDLGYAFVNVNPRMNIREDQKLVDIRYDFEKGNLVHFGEINITGNTKTRDKVIRREFRVKEGELYNGTRLRLSKERVERLGFFAPGEVVFNSVTRKDNKDVVDLDVQVKERSTGTITVGMGYGSIQKFFMTAQIAEMNLFGRGQNLSLNGQYASDRKSRSLSLGLTDPYFLDSNWSAGFDLFSVSFQIPGKYVQFKNGFDFKFGHPIFDDDIYLFSTYKFEHLQLEEVVPFLDVSDDIGNLSSINLSLVRDKRNNRMEATRGDYETIGGEWAGLGGNKRFAKALAEARYYHPLTDDLTFRSKIEFGQLFKTDPRNIPPAEKFYLGGPNNLKGFDTFSVSPKTKVGDVDVPVGGNTEFLYIAEVEFPLIREAGLKVVGFFDMGNSYNNFGQFMKALTGQPEFGFKKDIGFGIRWFSPIGPLRFEWGFPINKTANESDVVFNFFIGPPF